MKFKNEGTMFVVTGSRVIVCLYVTLYLHLVTLTSSMKTSIGVWLQKFYNISHIWVKRFLCTLWLSMGLWKGRGIGWILVSKVQQWLELYIRMMYIDYSKLNKIKVVNHRVAAPLIIQTPIILLAA